MDKIEHPLAGTWDVVNRHGEPRYVVEHDGKGGWWGVCQPDRPEDCYVLAASKDLLEVLKELMEMRDRCFIPNVNDWWDEMAQAAIDKAEGR